MDPGFTDPHWVRIHEPYPALRPSGPLCFY